jgi:hypothetical protein
MGDYAYKSPMKLYFSFVHYGTDVKKVRGGVIHILTAAK